MKYTVSNVINKPLEEVIAKFMDPNGLVHWMEGLQKMELKSGEQGEVGAVTDLHFLYKKKEMIIEETLLEKNLPNQIKFAYKSSMGYNEVEMLFEEISDSSVKQTNNSFFEFSGFMKAMSFLMKGLFKRQSRKYMIAFKKYIESV